MPAERLLRVEPAHQAQFASLGGQGLKTGVAERHSAGQQRPETVGHLPADHIEHVGFQLRLLRDHRMLMLEIAGIERRLLRGVLQQPVAFRVRDSGYAARDELTQRHAVLNGRCGGRLVARKDEFSDVGTILRHLQVDIPKNRGICRQRRELVEGSGGSREREIGGRGAGCEDHQHNTEADGNLGADLPVYKQRCKPVVLLTHEHLLARTVP